MNIRNTAAGFFQNIADYLHHDQGPLQIPDYLTGEMHLVADPEIQKQYQNLHRYTKMHLPDFVVTMRRDGTGGFIPEAAHKNSVPYLNAVTGDPAINQMYKDYAIKKFNL